jgi:hypothetical protein
MTDVGRRTDVRSAGATEANWSRAPAVPLVRVGPGLMASIRIPLGPSSAAQGVARLTAEKLARVTSGDLGN